jgi:hypothetical protein
MADEARARIVAATGTPALGILAAIDALKQAVAAEPLLRGAFDQVLANLQRQFAELAKRPGSAAEFLTKLPTSSIGSQRQTRATGGPLGAGQASLVGERGPELWIPQTAGNVVPLTNRRDMQRGSTYTVNVYGDVNDEARFTRRVVSALEEHERKNGRRVGAWS